MPSLPLFVVGKVTAALLNAVVGAVNPLGHSLIVPTGSPQGAVGGGSSPTFSVSALGKMTFTNAATASLNGVFSATYDDYLVVWKLTATSAAVNGGFKLRLAGTDQSLLYTSNLLQVPTTASAMSSIAGATTFAQVVRSGGTHGAAGSMIISAPQLAQYTFIHGASIDEAFWAPGGGALANAVQYDGLTLFMPSGTHSGTLQVFGINKG